MDDTWNDMPALQSTRETQAQAVIDRTARLGGVPQVVSMNSFPSFKWGASDVADHSWIPADGTSLNDVRGAPQQYAEDDAGSIHPVRDASNQERWIFHGMHAYPPPPLQPYQMPASPVLPPSCSGGGAPNIDFPDSGFPGMARGYGGARGATSTQGAAGTPPAGSTFTAEEGSRSRQAASESCRAEYGASPQGPPQRHQHVGASHQQQVGARAPTPSQGETGTPPAERTFTAEDGSGGRPAASETGRAAYGTSPQGPPQFHQGVGGPHQQHGWSSYSVGKGGYERRTRGARGSGSPSVVGSRTADEAVHVATSRTGGLDVSEVPKGFPRGPFPVDAAGLKAQVAAYTEAADCPMGGGFNVCLIRPMKNADGFVYRRSLGCTHRSGARSGYNCNWEATYEWSTEGWVLVQYHRHRHVEVSPTQDPQVTSKTTSIPLNHHNHELMESMTQVRAQYGGQCRLPLDLVPIGEMMSKAGCSTALIKMVFDDYAEEHGLDRTLYSYDYVARVFNRVDRSVADLDLDGLSQHLKEREEELGLNYELHLDPSGNLDMCFAQLADAMKDWARGGNSNILLFDPTAGTNRLGMKLCMFVTVSPTGKTTTAALALIRRENRHSFEWCLRSFAKAFRTPPSLFITDSDDEIAAAVDIVSSPRDVWTGVVHNLCVFHISKNLHGHLRKLFGANMKGWHELMNRFWRIAKESDISSRESFDADWESMCAFVTHTATVSEKLEHEMDWLQTRLYVRRHKWAARWVFGQFTAGCHSTQRAESNQAAKKASLRKNSSVSALMTHIERENVAGRDKAAISEEVLRMRQSISGGASIAVVRSLMRTLTPYAFKLVLQQAAQAVFYTSKVCDDFESEEDSIHRIVFEGCDVHNHQFIVTRTGNTDVDTLHFGEGSELPSSFDAPSDFGLSETRSHRWTTLKWCSCQFSVAFGGLPCRHILYLCMTQEVQEYPTDVIQ